VCRFNFSSPDELNFMKVKCNEILKWKSETLETCLGSSSSSGREGKFKQLALPASVWRDPGKLLATKMHQLIRKKGVDRAASRTTRSAV
jgi:hypothetical protein